MTHNAADRVLPYSYIVGQERLRTALELSYVAYSASGLLITGKRGTAKSTTVRSFCTMVYDGNLPVTLPINATDDRVLGGWNIRKFIQGRTDREPGLLEQANRKLLYIDEVNLLDDHTVDIILDVAASGILAVQMDGLDLPAIEVSFSLVGTMNPDEGALRPQLLDRFGLAVPIDTETDIQRRQKILLTVLKFEQESRLEHSSWIAEGRAADRQRATWLKSARRAWGNTEMSDEIAELCARVVVKFEIQSHRAEIELAKAARAVAALDGRKCVEPADVRRAAPYALSHRKLGVDDGGDIEWVPEDKERLAGIIPRD